MITEREYTSEAIEIQSGLLTGLKQHLRITSSDFDSSLELLLSAAIEIAEKECGCIFLPSIITLKAKSVIDTAGYYPAFECTSLKIDGVEKESSDVEISGGRVSVQADEGQAIEVVFEAGYLTFPAAVKAAVFLIAATLFNNPADKVEVLPKASTNLLKSFRRWQS